MSTGKAVLGLLKAQSGAPSTGPKPLNSDRGTGGPYSVTGSGQVTQDPRFGPVAGGGAR